MTHNAEFAGTIDIALLIFLTFVGFFFSLILYLRREDRREGYPLENDVTGQLEPASSFFFTARPKTFRLAHGGVFTAPNGQRDTHEVAIARTGVAPGSPFEPVGNPLTAGVGPGAYAMRAKRPDVLHDGSPKIVPLRLAPDYGVMKGGPDPRGQKVYGADGRPAGVVSDLWVDRMEFLVRYLEVELKGGRKVLVPQAMSDISRTRGTVKVSAVLASQFAGAPDLENPDQITLYEEERICGYFGAGYLYATPQRAEPIL